MHSVILTHLHRKIVNVLPHYHIYDLPSFLGSYVVSHSQYSIFFYMYALQAVTSGHLKKSNGLV